MKTLTPEKFNLKLPNAELTYFPNFFTKKNADIFFQQLRTEIPWRQDNITVFGKTHKQPRLTALYSQNSKTYTYSGITMEPLLFSTTLKTILTKIVEETARTFTTVLLNLYRDGSDSNGWHADDEKELGINPVIASISLGSERFFHFKHKKQKELRYNLLLKHGSLLIMEGEMQHYWLHQIPKSKQVIGERINLTFRTIN